MLVTTPLDTNWRKMDTSRSKRVDPMLHCQLIRSLMYFVNMRPDICFAVTSLIQFMVDPTMVHWVVSKHMLRYLKERIEYVLWYINVDRVKLEGFTNAYWTGSSIENKST